MRRQLYVNLACSSLMVAWETKNNINFIQCIQVWHSHCIFFTWLIIIIIVMPTSSIVCLYFSNGSESLIISKCNWKLMLSHHQTKMLFIVVYNKFNIADEQVHIFHYQTFIIHATLNCFPHAVQLHQPADSKCRN